MIEVTFYLIAFIVCWIDCSGPLENFSLIRQRCKMYVYKKQMRFCPYLFYALTSQ